MSSPVKPARRKPLSTLDSTPASQGPHSPAAPSSPPRKAEASVPSPRRALLTDGAPAAKRPSNDAIRRNLHKAKDARDIKSAFAIHFSATTDLAHAADKLKAEVWPFLSRYAQKRGELTFVSEVEPVAVDSESSLFAETQLLRLRTIAATRPFFVCFVGAVYGTPIEKYHSELIDSFPFVSNFPAVSLVDLEVLAASLNYNSETRKPSMIYIINHPNAANGVEDLSQAPEISPTQRALMQRFRERIKSGPLPITVVDDLDQAIEDLKSNIMDAIEQEFPPTTNLWSPTHISIALSSQIGFTNTFGSSYVPLGRSLEIITGIVDGKNEEYPELESFEPETPEPNTAPSSTPLALIAQSEATGHTALLAHWLYRSNLHRERADNVFVFFHFCGLNPYSSSSAAIAYRLVCELNNFLGIGDVVPFDLHQLTREIPAKLEELHQRKIRSLILLDGLSSCQEPEEALSWVPRSFPVSVTVLVSVGNHPELIAAVKERGWLMLNTGLLLGDSASTFIEHTAKTAGCKLNADDIRTIRKALQDLPARANPLFVQLMMALLRTANPESDPSLTRMVLAALLGVGDTAALFSVLLDRLEERTRSWHEHLLGDALSVVRLSVHGLTLTEIIHMLGVSKTAFTSLFSGFEDIIFTRIETYDPMGVVVNQRYCLRSEIFKDVITARYLSDAEALTRARKILVGHFGGYVTALKNPSIESVIRATTDGEFARGADELCWGMLNNIDREDVLEVLTDMSVFRALWSSDLRRDLYRVWSDVGAEENVGEVYWQNAMNIYWDALNSDGSMDPAVGTVIVSLLYDLGDLCLSLYNEYAYKFFSLCIELEEKALGPNRSSRLLGDIEFRSGLFGLTAGRSEEAFDHFYRAFTVRDELLGNHVDTATALVECGEILMASGNLADAGKSFAQASTIVHDAGIADYSPVAARVYNDLGLLSKKEDNTGRAENFYNQSLLVRQNSRSLLHPHTAVTLRNLGSLLFQLERLKDAQDAFTRALEISNAVHGQLHAATAACHEWLGEVLRRRDDPEYAIHLAMAERINEKLSRIGNSATLTNLVNS